MKTGIFLIVLSVTGLAQGVARSQNGDWPRVMKNNGNQMGHLLTASGLVLTGSRSGAVSRLTSSARGSRRYRNRDVRWLIHSLEADALDWNPPVSMSRLNAELRRNENHQAGYVNVAPISAMPVFRNEWLVGVVTTESMGEYLPIDSTLWKLASRRGRAPIYP